MWENVHQWKQNTFKSSGLNAPKSMTKIGGDTLGAIHIHFEQILVHRGNLRWVVKSECGTLWRINVMGSDNYKRYIDSGQNTNKDRYGKQIEINS